MIHAYASLQHYHDHLAPILEALPPELAGEHWSPADSKTWGITMTGLAPQEGLWLVASYADARRLQGRHLALVEHGAGQAYPGDARAAAHGSYSGGAGLEHVGLFLCPNETVAMRWRTRYPLTPTVVVGCPKLDPWHSGRRGRRCDTSPKNFRGDVTACGIEAAGSITRPVVAVTWHHDAAMIPEQTSAVTHYRDHLGQLRDAVAAAGGQLLGHTHPRSVRARRLMWRRFGVPFTEQLDEVFDLADVLVADNTSALPEFASLGRPVVWLNAPWYRRHVYHGGRFWDWPAGQVQVDEPGDLVGAVFRALEDPPEVREARQRMVQDIYARVDGGAAAAAAQALLEHHARLP